MKFKLRYVLIPFFSLILTALIVLFFLHIKRTITVYDYEKKLEACVQEGDIICRLGDRIWSLYFKDLSPRDKRFSHLGIIHIVDNEIMVINAEGISFDGQDKVCAEALPRFIKPASMLGVYRLQGVDGNKISKEALKMLGRPFDWAFDHSNSEKIYCTELLYVALQEAAPEIELQTAKIFGKDIIPLEAISSSPDFTEVLFLQ